MNSFRIFLTQVFTHGVASSSVELLRDSPCRHSCRLFYLAISLSNELAFASRLGFTFAKKKKNEQLLRVNVL